MELTAIPHFPRQLLPELQHPLPEFFSFSSSPFSCLHLSNDPLSPMGTILVYMGWGQPLELGKPPTSLKAEEN